MSMNQNVKNVIANQVEEGRREIINGENYTVYPVVMLTVGVHSGSDGPTLYTAEELSSYAMTWNGVPVTLRHPNLNGQPVSANSPEIYHTQVLGKVFNARYENGKLKAEIWLNDNDLQRIEPTLKNRIQNGEKIEVSTGLFCDGIIEEGAHNNEEYNSIATNIRPDHLAILPDEQGACSWGDGCGIRSNEKGGGMKITKNKKEVPKERDKYFIHNELNFLNNEGEDTELISIIHQKIDAMDVQGERINYLMKVYSDFVIYKAHVRTDNNTTIRLYKREYRVTNEGIEWASDPVPVKENVSYTEIENNKNKKKEDTKTNKNEEGDYVMADSIKKCCPERVDELIKSNEKFTEDDKEMLLSMTQDQFEFTVNMASKEEKTETQEDDGPVDSLDTLLENASPELREVIINGQMELRKKKQNLIETIKANKNNSFSDEELKTFDVGFLEKLASMVPEKKKNYAANAAPAFPEEEVEALPNVNTAYTQNDKDKE